MSQLKIELLPVWFGTARMGSKPGGDFKKSEIISDFRSLFRLFCVYRGAQVNLHKNGTSALELCPNLSKRYLRWVILVL